MKKSISFFLLGAALLAVLLSGCDAAGGNEPSTDNSEAFLSVIEKSSPITSGNLITKTKTDEDGNIIVQYYDNENNLVEYFTWDDGWDDLIEHAVMTYSESDKIMSKEIIDPEGKENIYTSYQYDSDDNLLQYTVSEYKDGLLHKATVFDSSDKETGYTLSYYNDSAKVTKVERYDSHDDLCEYYMYEYDIFNGIKKCIVKNFKNLLISGLKNLLLKKVLMKKFVLTKMEIRCRGIHILPLNI